MKKHLLLTEAMRRFPAGSVARFKSAPTVDHVSDGIFQILDINHRGNNDIFSGSGLNCFYISHDEEGVYIGEWAEIVTDNKTSILDGKVAISVNNEREFKLLMEHYESKEWKSHDSFMPTTVFNSHLGIKNIFPATVRYENNFGVSYPAHHADNCYAIISFESFAAEVGIKVPVFVMTTEDDVPLFFGDPFWHVLKYKDEWKLNTSLGIHNSDKRFVFDEINYKDHMVLVKPEINKAFSTREAAEIWIAEQNKPKQISIELYDSKTAILTKEGVQVTEISSSTKSIWLTPDDLSKIVDASSDMFGKEAKGE